MKEAPGMYRLMDTSAGVDYHTALTDLSRHFTINKFVNAVFILTIQIPEHRGLEKL